MGLFVLNACFAQQQAPPADKGKDKSKSNKLGIGIKAGLNFANVTSVSSINNSSRTGFMAGLFLATPSHGLFGYRTELLFSRQGYDYKNNANTGSVNLNYILFAHLFAINITKLVQLQLGGQIAYLIDAKSDSNNAAQSANPYSKILSYYNRFDYGATGGIEIHPFMGLLVGARYNLFFGDLYKMPGAGSAMQSPSFIPSVNVRNNLLQVFAGYRF